MHIVESHSDASRRCRGLSCGAQLLGNALLLCLSGQTFPVNLKSTKTYTHRRLQAFQEHYYSTFDSNRQALSGLYKDDAYLTFEGQTQQGCQAIMQKLSSLPFQQVCPDQCAGFTHACHCRPQLAH